MFDDYIAGADEATRLDIYANHMPDGLSPNTYDDNLKLIGVCDLESPSAVHIYASTFESKDTIKELIKGDTNSYNSSRPEEQHIDYTDYVEMLMSGVTTIIEAVSAVLIAFVSISLVVSSVMIGIITNISVLERTKEIGILRAIGASKKDISRIFNAETIIVGLCAGVIGIAASLLLLIPINHILLNLTKIASLRAILPPAGGVILILISIFLTYIAGLIPSGMAARKNPVEALRTE
jgi:putative ABC transport system permease protein